MIHISDSEFTFKIPLKEPPFNWAKTIMHYRHNMWATWHLQEMWKLQTEVRDWCNENIGSGRWMFMGGNDPEIAFLEHTDYILFTLRWFGSVTSDYFKEPYCHTFIDNNGMTVQHVVGEIITDYDGLC